LVLAQILNCLKSIEDSTEKIEGTLMNKKGISTLVIVAIIVIIVVVAGIAVYVLYSGGGEETPTPTPAPTPDIEGATSLQFDVATSEKDISFMAKNLGTSDVLLRVEEVYADGSSFVYIMNQTDQTVWAKFDSEWTDESASWATYWTETWEPSFNGYKAELANWSGTGDLEIQAGGETQTISNIVVNPTLADSLFQTSG
jgi:FlaG/FlaF family flagellin (archaellin)